MYSLERFWAKVDKSGPTPANRPDLGPCWNWIGAKLWSGYGYVQVGWPGKRRNIRAHRISYELAKGKIPKELEPDHLCRNRACVNPNHLEAVTRKVNVLRGIGFAAVNAKKTHCPKGHEFTKQNTYYQNGGRRYCRECKLKREKAKNDAIRRSRQSS